MATDSLARVQARISQIQSRLGLPLNGTLATPPSPTPTKTSTAKTSTSKATSSPATQSFSSATDKAGFAAGVARRNEQGGITNTGGALLPGVERWNALATKIAHEEGVDPRLLLALVQQESGGNPSITSSAGAKGLTQLMPATAAGLGVNPNDPESNLRGGARYLKTQLTRFGTVELALAAYNAGPNAVAAYGGIPPFNETKNYVSSIMSLYSRL